MIAPGENTRRFVVVQMGARMGYAAAAALQRAGMLEDLYTDIHSQSGFIPRLARVLPNRLSPAPVRRLLGRHVPDEIPRRRIRSFPLRAIIHRTGAGKMEAYLGRRLLARGFSGANSLYTMTTADFDVVRAAKEQNLFVVHEQFLAPDELREMQHERQLFPGVEKDDAPEQRQRFETEHQTHWRLVDRILCPSVAVKRSSIAMGADPDKTVLVPYCSRDGWNNLRRDPVPRRILFVGSVGLRKGSHYLAQAVAILNKRKFHCEVIAVGPYDRRVRLPDFFKGPKYLGQIPRSEVDQYFRTSEIFVLPTLSEAFPLGILEALSCGLPVITTPRCSCVVRDGVEGFIVPPRDAAAVADRIESLLTDRRLLEAMSIQARQRAAEFTLEKYSERLVSAVAAGPGVVQ